ncbi:MAG: family 20 glycosylhydrolase [Bacteroidetes bacterium]|nr:family 20 glycosylhydrolase [Bacteroidota bacterium]
MKPLFYSIPLFIIFSCLLSAQQLIPLPVEMKRGNGNFTLTASSTIGYNTKEARSTADMFVNILRLPTGFAVTPTQGKSSDVQFSILEPRNKQIGGEGYLLDVSAERVHISANTSAGLYYGMQTLLQLLPYEIMKNEWSTISWTIPSVSIIDYPRFGWRGLMLDVSRHFFSKDDVKRYIDQMSRYKFNTFHWHLSDDNGWRIQIKSLPKLTEVGAWRVERFGAFGSRIDPKPDEPATYGGFYTHEDIKEIIRFAAERNVTIVPEIDLPGHSMAALAAYPELSTRKDTNTRVNPGTRFAEWYGDGKFKMNIENTLDPSNEKVYQFVDKVMTEVAALFPGKYIHVGGDECYKGYWETDSNCIALMKNMKYDHAEQLQGYFMARVEKILTSKGKKLLGWDEILEGGSISPDATVMSWRGVKGGIEAASRKHNVVMTPTTFAYIDYNQGDQTVDPPVYASLRVKKSYSFDPVPEGVDAKYILGGQGNLWTENIPHFRAVEYMIYPRAWALAEVYWSPKEKKDWAGFSSRMESHFARFDVAGINYSTAVYDAVIKTSRKVERLMLEMETELSGLEIFFTLDDTMPDELSPKYSSPVMIPDGPVTLRAITYRNGKPIGHLITLKRDELEKRAGR